MPDQLLSDRIPGQSVMVQALRTHRMDPPRTFLRRLLGASPLSKDSGPWYLGALGEIAVAGRLGTLGPGWTVLHSVPVGNGSSDIDHIIIGPGGVFTINTKNHASQPVWVARRTFMVAGQKKRHIPNALYEAGRASQLLSRAVNVPVRVRPLIVVVNPKSLTIKEAPSEAAVLTDAQLVPWLRSRPPVLGPDMLARLEKAAIQPRTWRKRPLDHEDALTVWKDFESLRLMVEQARKRRAICVLAVPVAAVVALSSGIPGHILQLVLQR
jgi:Nuclease-related domain